MTVERNSATENGGKRSRPTRTSTFLKLALVISKRSTCRRASVGCLIIDSDNQVLSMGYNGSPPGYSHCLDHGCIKIDGHCIRTLHAEMNALSRVDGFHPESVGFCTHAPCITCLKVGLVKGVYTWYYLHDYADSLRTEFIRWYNSDIQGAGSELLLYQINEADLEG